MSVRALAYPAAMPRLGGWARHILALALPAGAILALYARDATGMAAIWLRSSSYEHCLLIGPVIAWLVWLRRDALAVVRLQGWSLPLVWVAVGAAGWLLGQAAGVAAARQLGLVMMLQGAVAATLGPAATRILAFPLSYALFLVPLGDALVPPLQTLTARMCMVLLDLARVPARLDGVFIATPAGLFKVAEACSGAKFLIAMAALATLVAHLGFRTWRRRIPFVGAALAIALLANGVRAFATIRIAQWRGAAAAAGFDHIVYGWLFFAIVIALVMAAGWRFFDRAPDAVPAPGPAQACAVPAGAVAALVLLTAAAPAAYAHLQGARTATIADDARLPAIAGWRGEASSWAPRFDGADGMIVRRYRDNEGREADLAVALYARLRTGHELVGYGHDAADGRTGWTWLADRTGPAGWRGERLAGPGGAVREAATVYVVGAFATASAVRVKLATVATSLGGGDPLAAAVVVSGTDKAAVARLVAAIGDPVAFVHRVAAGG